MKLVKLRLVLDVDFDPQGLSADELAANLRGIVHDAAGNGTFTGDSPATVEKYNYKVTVRKGKKRSVNYTRP